MHLYSQSLRSLTADYFRTKFSPSRKDYQMLSDQIKPLAYLKANATEIISGFESNPEPLVITQNGEAKMVVMSMKRYDQDRQSLALLRLLALGKQELAEGKFTDADEFFREMGR